MWQSSNERAKAEKRIDELIAEGNARENKLKEDPANSTELKSKYAASIVSEMRHVTWRTAWLFGETQSISWPKHVDVDQRLFIGFTFYDLSILPLGMQNGMFMRILVYVVSAPLINQIKHNV